MHQNKSSDKAHGLVRELSLKEGVAIGLGTMIGAGIFVLAAIAAERAGPASAISYVLAGTLCLSRPGPVLGVDGAPLRTERHLDAPPGRTQRQGVVENE